MGLSFDTALSGLHASSQSISVAGNNIANANTTGFKANGITFADVFSSNAGARLNGTGGTIQAGNGVRVASTPVNFAQGAVVSSETATNAAIEGNGFFIVKNANGEVSYTRAGEFLIDRNSRLVTPSGHKVQGFAAVNGVVPSGAGLSDLIIPIGQTEGPVVTANATFRMNLNPTDLAGTEFHAPVVVYDSKGVSHQLDVVFTKQANGSYDVIATMDGNATQASVNGGAPSGAPVNFTFDANGQLTAPNTLTFLPDQTLLNGAVLPSIDINLRDANGTGYVTNYASPSSVSSTNQNGYSSSELIGSQYSANDGGLYAVFSNGQRRLLGNLGLATFNAQAGLAHTGNNLYSETVSSGPPSVGIPGTGGRGYVTGLALEQSNVDLAAEFTDLIIAQRSFQANSRVVSTISQTLQDLLQIS